MPYIGKQLVRGQNRKLDDISGSFNGSNTVFNLTVGGDSITPGSALQLFISVDGVLQNPNTDFTVAGNQITFSTAPGSGLSFFGILQGDAVDFNTPADGSVTTPKLGSNLTLVDPNITGTILEDVYTITDGAAFEVDPGNGSVQLITLGANRTPKATNFTAGEAVTLMVDDGTAYTLTWSDATFGGSGVVWKTDAGAAPTLNTTGYTVIVLWKVGTQVYGARVGDA